MPLQIVIASLLLAGTAVIAEPPTDQKQGEHQVDTDKPAIARLAQLWKDLDRSRLDPLLVVKPLEPTLVLDESTPGYGTEAELVATLVEFQPKIKQLIEVSALPIEQFGPAPDLNDENPNAHMEYPRAWIQNYVRILSADASRLWEERQADDAVARHVAIFRFSSWLFAQRDDSLCRSTATGMVMLNCKKLIAKLDDGMDRAMSPAAVKMLDDAIAVFDSKDPGDLLATWADSAQDSVRWFRAELAGEDAPKRYAKYLREYGVFRGSPNLLMAVDPRAKEALADFDGLLPEKETADEVLEMSRDQLIEALDQAEKLIEPTQRALLAEDRQAIREIATRVKADRTQLAHSIVGPAGAILSFSLNTREAIQTVQKRLDVRVK